MRLNQTGMGDVLVTSSRRVRSTATSVFLPLQPQLIQSQLICVKQDVSSVTLSAVEFLKLISEQLFHVRDLLSADPHMSFC